jgi:hypothetical protein
MDAPLGAPLSLPCCAPMFRCCVVMPRPCRFSLRGLRPADGVAPHSTMETTTRRTPAPPSATDMFDVDFLVDPYAVAAPPVPLCVCCQRIKMTNGNTRYLAPNLNYIFSRTRSLRDRDRFYRIVDAYGENFYIKCNVDTLMNDSIRLRNQLLNSYKYYMYSPCIETKSKHTNPIMNDQRGNLLLYF